MSKLISPIPEWCVRKAIGKVDQISKTTGRSWDVRLWEENRLCAVFEGDQQVSPEFNHGYSLMSWLDGVIDGLSIPHNRSEAPNIYKVRLVCSQQLWQAYIRKHLVVGAGLPAHTPERALLAVHLIYPDIPIILEQS